MVYQLHCSYNNLSEFIVFQCFRKQTVIFVIKLLYMSKYLITLLLAFWVIEPLSVIRDVLSTGIAVSIVCAWVFVWSRYLCCNKHYYFKSFYDYFVCSRKKGVSYLTLATIVFIYLRPLQLVLEMWTTVTTIILSTRWWVVSISIHNLLWFKF